MFYFNIKQKSSYLLLFKLKFLNTNVNQDLSYFSLNTKWLSVDQDRLTNFEDNDAIIEVINSNG